MSGVCDPVPVPYLSRCLLGVLVYAVPVVVVEWCGTKPHCPHAVIACGIDICTRRATHSAFRR